MRQRYVARELTHFVGRTLVPDEDAQYDLLMKILSSGWLRVGGRHVGTELSETSVHTTYHHPGKLSDPEGLIDPAVVCFCDIPLVDLTIHMQKYGRFAIAFRKEYLIAKGAAPVFYVPKGVPLYGRSRAEILDELGPTILGLHAITPDPEHPGVIKRHDRTALETFVEELVLCYLKPFDETKQEDDPDNYYMEREWRTRTNIRFTLDDVYRLILPEQYKTRLRQHAPGYLGQITFV